MTVRKLRIACPVCGSGDVVYSCTPDCCFNHVCGACGTVFEPATTLRGGVASGVVPPAVTLDASDPAVACARCDSPSVGMAEDDVLVCTACGALLDLQYTEIVPGQSGCA